MEDNKNDKEQKVIKNNRPKPVKIGKESIIMLRHRGSGDVKEAEEKYAEKFGCKVVILESNIDYVGKIDG